METLSAAVTNDVRDPGMMNLGEKASAAVAAIMARDIDRKSLLIVAVAADFKLWCIVGYVNELDANDSLSTHLMFSGPSSTCQPDPHIVTLATPFWISRQHHTPLARACT